MKGEVFAHLHDIVQAGTAVKKFVDGWSSPEKVDTQLGPDDYWTRRCVHGGEQTAIQSGIQG